MFSDRVITLESYREHCVHEQPSSGSYGLQLQSRSYILLWSRVSCPYLQSYPDWSYGYVYSSWFVNPICSCSNGSVCSCFDNLLSQSVVYPSPSTSVPAAPVSADPQLSTGPQTMPAQPVQYPLQQDPVPVQPSPYVSQPLPTPIQSDAYTPSIQSTPYVSQPLPTPFQSDAYTPSIQSTPYVSQPLPAPEQMGTYVSKRGFISSPTAVADPNQLVAVNIVSSDPTSSSEPFTDVTLGTAFVFVSCLTPSPELVYCPHCHMNVMTKVENTSL